MRAPLRDTTKTVVLLPFRRNCESFSFSDVVFGQVSVCRFSKKFQSHSLLISKLDLKSFKEDPTGSKSLCSYSDMEVRGRSFASINHSAHTDKVKVVGESPFRTLVPTIVLFCIYIV